MSRWSRRRALFRGEPGITSWSTRLQNPGRPPPMASEEAERTPLNEAEVPVAQMMSASSLLFGGGGEGVESRLPPLSTGGPSPRSFLLARRESSRSKPKSEAAMTPLVGRALSLGAAGPQRARAAGFVCSRSGSANRDELEQGVCTSTNEPGICPNRMDIVMPAV
jgi:hypothetical protein